MAKKKFIIIQSGTSIFPENGKKRVRVFQDDEFKGEFTNIDNAVGQMTTCEGKIIKGKLVKGKFIPDDSQPVTGKRDRSPEPEQSQKVIKTKKTGFSWGRPAPKKFIPDDSQPVTGKIDRSPDTDVDGGGADGAKKKTRRPEDSWNDSDLSDDDDGAVLLNPWALQMVYGKPSKKPKV